MAQSIPIGVRPVVSNTDSNKTVRRIQKNFDKNPIKLKFDEKALRRPLGRITGDLQQFDSALAASNARVLAFGASTAVLAAVITSFKQLANAAIEVEKTFVDINRILNISNESFKKFGDQLFTTAQKTSSSFQDAANAALEFSRQGLKTEEVLKRTSDALTLVRLTGINAKKAVDLLTATVNAFTDLDTTSAVNKFIAVETKFAVAARDLVEGLSRVGSAAVDAKVDMDELNALITAVQQTTGRGGAVIGNALKTIFTRLQRTATLEALERFNVQVRDIEGNILPATMVLDNFAQKYEKLGDQTKAYLREQVAGVFQANILSAILKDLNKEQSNFSSALTVSRNATNESAQANEKLNQTLSSLLQNTGTEFLKLQQVIGQETFSPVAKGLSKFLLESLKSVNGTIEKEGIGADLAHSLFKGFRNVLSGPALIGSLILIGTIVKKTFVDIGKAIPTLIGITTEAQKRAQTELAVLELIKGQDINLNEILKDEDLIEDKVQQILRERVKVTREMNNQSRLASEITGKLAGKNIALTDGGKTGRIRNKATGYTPAIRSEQSAINAGVGGAPSSAYPVVIPNFAFGGGAKGPVVANSSEVMVPNYGGSGGSAIFNQNMIKKSGMPSGAVPIASQGHVPNYASGRSRRDATKATLKRHSGNVLDFFRYNQELGLKVQDAINETEKYVKSIIKTESAQNKILTNLKKKISPTVQSVKEAEKTLIAQKQTTQATKEIAKEQKKQSRSLKKLFKTPRFGLGAGAAFGIPMLTGAIEQGAFGNRSRLDMSTGERFTQGALSHGASFASTGFMLGGPAGAAVGGILGLGMAAFKAAKSVEELQQKAENYDKVTEDVTRVSEEYIQAQKDILSASSENELENAQERAAKSLDQLRKSGTGLDEKFLDAEKDITKLTAALSNYEAQRLKGSLLASGAARAKGFEFLDVDQTPRPPSFPARIKRENVFGKKSLKEARSQFGGLGLLFETTTPKQFQEIAEASGKSVDELAKVLLEVSDTLNFENLPQIKEFLSSFSGDERKGIFGALPSIFKSFDKKKEGDDKIKQSLLNFTKIKDQILAAGKDTEIASQAQTFAKDLEIGRMKIYQSFLKGVEDPVAEFEMSSSIEKAAFAEKIRKARTDFYTTQIKTLPDLFGEAGKDDEQILLMKQVSESFAQGGDLGQFSVAIRELFSGTTAEELERQFDDLTEKQKNLNIQLENGGKLIDERTKLEKIVAQNAARTIRTNRDSQINSLRRGLANSKAEGGLQSSIRGLNFGISSLGDNPRLTEVGKVSSEIGLRRRIAGKERSLVKNKVDIAVINLLEKQGKEIGKVEDAIKIQQALPSSPKTVRSINSLQKQKAFITEKYRLQIQKEHADSTNELAKINEELNQNTKRLAQIYERTGVSGFKRGATQSFTNIESETETFAYRIGVDIPQSFQDGMVSALNTAMDKADSLGEALRNAAIGFLTEIRNAFNQQAVGQIMTGFKHGFSGTSGTPLKGYQSGMYISGSRTGDRNPALLEDGEYVLNRNAVRAVGGPAALDSLNFGMAPRFQGGGAFVNEAATSSRMSGAFLAGNTPELADARQAARDAAEAAAQKAMKKREFINAIASTLFMGAVSGAMGSFASSSQTKGGKFGAGQTPININGQNLKGQNLPASIFSSPYVAQSGGLVPTSFKSSNAVPTFMAGGQNVSAPAVRRFQSGGSVGKPSSASLGAGAGNTNNVKININMGSNGQVSGASMQTSNTGSQDAAANAQDFSKKVESAVMKVIQREQRVSGTLPRKRGR